MTVQPTIAAPTPDTTPQAEANARVTPMMEQYLEIKAAHPEGLLYLYEGADHGFNCEQRPSYNPAAAALAKQRTLEFFARHIAGV